MEPIGIQAKEWSIGYGRTYEVDGLPVVANWGGGSFTARATARVGRLLLCKGNWEGKQLIEPKWVDELVTYRGTPLPPRPESDPFPAPALGWYNNNDGFWPKVPKDAFMGAGAGNQVLMVIPSLDLIVVRNGEVLGDPDKGEGFWKGLVQYLFNPLMDAVVDTDEL
jgi:CubicO group peptidase (beta-lactamase class C family)